MPSPLVDPPWGRARTHSENTIRKIFSLGCEITAQPLFNTQLPQLLIRDYRNPSSACPLNDVTPVHPTVLTVALSLTAVKVND